MHICLNKMSKNYLKKHVLILSNTSTLYTTEAEILLNWGIWTCNTNTGTPHLQLFWNIYWKAILTKYGNKRWSAVRSQCITAFARELSSFPMWYTQSKQCPCELVHIKHHTRLHRHTLSVPLNRRFGKSSDRTTDFQSWASQRGQIGSNCYCEEVDSQMNPTSMWRGDIRSWTS